MIEPRVFEIKTHTYHDAVIYVHENYTKVTKNPDDPEKKIYEEIVQPIAVIPVIDTNGDGDSNDLVSRVRNTCDALAELYAEHPDVELRITYSINSHPYVINL